MAIFNCLWLLLDLLQKVSEEWLPFKTMLLWQVNMFIWRQYVEDLMLSRTFYVVVGSVCLPSSSSSLPNAGWLFGIFAAWFCHVLFLWDSCIIAVSAIIHWSSMILCLFLPFTLSVFLLISNLGFKLWSDETWCA